MIITVLISAPGCMTGASSHNIFLSLPISCILSRHLGLHSNPDFHSWGVRAISMWLLYYFPLNLTTDIESINKCSRKSPTFWKDSFLTYWVVVNKFLHDSQDQSPYPVQQLLFACWYTGMRSPGVNNNFQFNRTIPVPLVDALLSWELGSLDQQSPKLSGEKENCH